MIRQPRHRGGGYSRRRPFHKSHTCLHPHVQIFCSTLTSIRRIELRCQSAPSPLSAQRKNANGESWWPQPLFYDREPTCLRRTQAVLQNQDRLIQGPPPYRVHDRGIPQVRVGQDSETSFTGEILGRAIQASVMRWGPQENSKTGADPEHCDELRYTG
jgi:hypothetical protein